MVKDINPDGNSYPYSFTAVNNTLYFYANDGKNGTELWKSNGTEAGTVMVKDINPDGNSDSNPYGTSYPSELTAVGNTLYFRAYGGKNGTELWKSDGTKDGTVMVKDINQASSGDPSSYPWELTAVNNTLYFRANDGTNGRELWKSDGTEAGTVMVKDINPSDSGYPWELTAVNNTLYFTVYYGDDKEELWKSDGTKDGTVMVKDINPDYSGDPRELTAVGVTLYFSDNDGDDGFELWAFKTVDEQEGKVMCSVNE